MRQWIFQIEPRNGNVVVTFRTIGTHTCYDFDPEEFGEFANMVNGALGDSKLAAS